MDDNILIGIFLCFVQAQNYFNAHDLKKLLGEGGHGENVMGAVFVVTGFIALIACLASKYNGN